MKKTLLILILIFSLGALFAQRVLQDFYYGDYEDINRVVLVLDAQASYRLIQDKNRGEIIVRLDNTNPSLNLPRQVSYDYRVLKSITVIERNGELDFVIQSLPSFYLENFELSADDYKIVLDIFLKENPTTLSEMLNYAHFYFVVGYHNKAMQLIRAIERITTDETDIYYYLGKIHLQRNNIDQAYEALTKVDRSSEFYQLARLDINQLERRFSHLTRSVEPEPVQTEPPADTPEDDEEMHRPLVESRELDISSDELYEQYRNYFIANDNINRRLILTAVVTASNQDYEKALDLLQQVDKTSEFYRDALRQMYYIYLEKGDEQNARVLHSVVGDNMLRQFVRESGIFSSAPDTRVEFLEMDVKMWMALILAVFMALIVAFISSLIANSRINRMKKRFGDDEVEYHEKKIKEAYSATESVDKPEEKNSSTDDEKGSKEEEDENIPIIEEDNLDYDDMPVISEELDDADKSELDIDEGEAKKEAEPMKNEYKKKMVLKLYKDGWDSEAIAKELQVSQNEVDLILKMDS